MKSLQNRLLGKLQTLRGELVAHGEPAYREDKLQAVFSEVKNEMEGYVAVNFQELIGHILQSFDHDIDRIIAFLHDNISNSFDQGTLKEDVEDGFDARYGTETSIVIDQLELPEVITLQRIQSSSRFHPTPIKIMRLILKSLVNYGVRYEQWNFIDIGAGLGRNLLLASEYPFKRIMGIEISSSLCEKAAKNLAAYNARASRPSKAEIECTDVLDFSFPGPETILYFWEPFTKEVMQQLIWRLEEQARNEDVRFLLVFLGYAYLQDIEAFTFRPVGNEYPDATANGASLQVSVYSNY